MTDEVTYECKTQDESRLTLGLMDDTLWVRTDKTEYDLGRSVHLSPAQAMDLAQRLMAYALHRSIET